MLEEATVRTRNRELSNAFVVALVAICSIECAANADWTTSLLDSGNVRRASIDVDPQGGVHIAYQFSDSGLMYCGSASGWQTEEVDTLAEWCSIRAGSDGVPQIAYSGGVGGGHTHPLKYASRTGGSWQSELVDGGFDKGYHPSLALTDGNDPVIAHWCFQGTFWHTLLYTVGNGAGSWNPLSDRLREGRHPSIALDSAGYAHIAARTNDHRLLYGTYNGTTWNWNTLESHVDHVPAIALGPGDVPQILYCTDAGTVKHRRWNGSSWDITEIDQGLATTPCGLALDSQGKPHAVYLSLDRRAAKYAQWTGTAWSTEIIAEDLSPIGWYASGIDIYNDVPHVVLATGDGSGGEIIYAVPEPATLSLLALGGFALIRCRRI